MAIRHTNQPTASPRGAAIRRGVGSILLLLAGCADLDDLEARADVDDAGPGTILADGPGAAADECRGLQHAPRLEVTAPLPRDNDLVLAAGDEVLRVQVRNVSDEVLAIEPRLTWRAAGEVSRETAGRVELAPGEAREVAIELRRDLETRAQPASLDVRLRAWHGAARRGDESLTTMFFHVDARSGRLHVYDQDGMVARHRAGDLLGTHRAVAARADLAGVGVARPARPEDLMGDPTDTRNTRGASR